MYSACLFSPIKPKLLDGNLHICLSTHLAQKTTVEWTNDSIDKSVNWKSKEVLEDRLGREVGTKRRARNSNVRLRGLDEDWRKKTATHQKSEKLKSPCFPLLDYLSSFVKTGNIPCHNPRARLVLLLHWNPQRKSLGFLNQLLCALRAEGPLWAFHMVLGIRPCTEHDWWRRRSFSTMRHHWIINICGWSSLVQHLELEMWEGRNNAHIYQCVGKMTM